MSGTSFAEKVVLVTGAASGLGRATALAFADEGALLAISDVAAAGLAETVEMIAERGGKTLSTRLDVSDATACAQWVADAAEHYGKIDVLCNVAGMIRFQHALQITPAEWDMTFAVNVRGPFFLIQAALPHLIESAGAVVSVASASAFLGHSYLCPYAASKAALVNLTKSLAIEYAHTNVHINALAPGGMLTPMVTSASFPEGIDMAMIARFSGLRGISQPEELTELILFLASPRGKVAHGTCFVADRGVLAG